MQRVGDAAKEAMMRRAVFIVAWLVLGGAITAMGGAVGGKPAIPVRKVQATLTMQAGHAACIHSVAFSPDGRQVLTGGDDRTPRLWDVRTGRELRQFHGHTGWVFSVALSPNGMQALSSGGEDRTARLWDTRTGKELRQFVHTGWVMSVAFSPDGKLALTGSEDKTARLWDLGTGKEVRRFDHPDAVQRVTFSKDGRRVITGGLNGVTWLWDTKSGKQLQSFPGHTRKLLSVALSPDATLAVTASEDSTVRLWNVGTGKEVRRFTGHTKHVYSGTFSPDGSLILTGGLDNTARLWDVGTGKEVRQFTRHTEPVYSVAFSPDGRLALTGDGRGTARLWEAGTGKEIRVFSGSADPVPAVAFSSDGKRMLTGGTLGGTARLWDAGTGQQVFRLTGQSDTEFSKPLVRFKPDSVDAVAFSPDGRHALTGGWWDGTARLWDADTGKEVRRFSGHKGKLNSLAFSPDGRRAITGGMDGTARIWDTNTGKELYVLASRASAVQSVAFSPNGKRVLTGDSDNTARLWVLETCKELRRFTGHTDRVQSVAFSPDGKRVLTGSEDKTARLWDTATARELHQFAGHTHTITSVAFSPDGKWVLTGSFDRTARLWNAETGKEVRRFDGHTAWIRTVAFSPDGKRVLTGSQDKTARLWDVATGKELVQLLSFTDGTWAVIDPAGRFDASNGGDVQGLHWVIGMEPIALKQLKERYYDPGLLAKHMGLSKEPLRKVEAFRSVKLYPEVAVTTPKPGDTELAVSLTNRGGGIGRVQVLVNGKELLADARGPRPDPDAAKAALRVDLSAAALLPGQENTVEVIAWNADGYLSSRGGLVRVAGPKKAPEPVQLHAVVVGTGSYANPALNLRYAAKDAEDFAAALRLGGNRLFGAEKVHLTLLSTSGNPGTVRPTRANLAKAFADLRTARPGDVLVVYLAGHGVALQQGSDVYCYLTADARTLDLAVLADPAVRAATTITSDELTAWVKAIPALKQVMVLDTCAAGAAAAKLTDRRDVSGDQVRAIERLKDRTGFHVLMGCAADRVSYEASQYAQGLLTYSLLEGMRGTALREGEFVDVSKLFQYAADRVPQLARHVGGVQRPLIAAPRGTSFDVGRLGPDDRAKVPLALVRPVVTRPALQNRDEAEDDLGLTALVRRRLAEASQPAGRGGTAAIVYVPEDDFPGAVRPSGAYTVRGDGVTVRLRLRRDGKLLAEPSVEGKKSDLAGLAERVAQAILKAAARHEE